MTARVVVETPRTEPCMPGCPLSHMDRRVLQAGEYVLVEKADGECDEAATQLLERILKDAWASDELVVWI